MVAVFVMKMTMATKANKVGKGVSEMSEKTTKPMMRKMVVAGGHRCLEADNFASMTNKVHSRSWNYGGKVVPGLKQHNVGSSFTLFSPSHVKE